MSRQHSWIALKTCSKWMMGKSMTHHLCCLFCRNTWSMMQAKSLGCTRGNWSREHGRVSAAWTQEAISCQVRWCPVVAQLWEVQAIAPILQAIIAFAISLGRMEIMEISGFHCGLKSWIVLLSLANFWCSSAPHRPFSVDETIVGSSKLHQSSFW